MRWLLIVCLLGCGDKAPAPSAAAPASKAAPVSRAAPSSEIDRWRRRPVAEPHPEARALYRRAVMLIHRGQPAAAEPLFARIQESWPDSRFARRLSTEGIPPSVISLAGALVPAVTGILAAVWPKPARTP